MIGNRLHSPVHSIRSALLELLESRKALLYVIMQWKSVFHFQFADRKPQSTCLRLKRQDNVWVRLHSKKRATFPVPDSWKRRKIYLKQKLKRWKQVEKWYIETPLYHFLDEGTLSLRKIKRCEWDTTTNTWQVVGFEFNGYAFKLVLSTLYSTVMVGDF